MDNVKNNNVASLYLESRLSGRELTVSFDFIPGKMKVSIFMSFSWGKRKRKIIAPPHRVPEAFYLTANRLNV